MDDGKYVSVFRALPFLSDTEAHIGEFMSHSTISTIAFLIFLLWLGLLCINTVMSLAMCVSALMKYLREGRHRISRLYCSVIFIFFWIVMEFALIIGAVQLILKKGDF